MTTEIIKGVIAGIVIVGAVASVFLGNLVAQNFLIPLAGFAFGYYFNQIEKPAITRFRAAFGNK